MSKIKKNDLVQVMNGKEKGKTGKVTEINTQKNMVYVSGLNMIKKAVKPRSQQEKGGIHTIEAPIHISKLCLVSKGKPSRVCYNFENGKKIRIAKKTGEVL